MDIPYQKTSDSQILLWSSFTDVPVIQQNLLVPLTDLVLFTPTNSTLIRPSLTIQLTSVGLAHACPNDVPTGP